MIISDRGNCNLTEWQRPLGERASAFHLSSERTGDIRRKSHQPAIELSKHF
jgi:hypothetical protein